MESMNGQLAAHLKQQKENKYLVIVSRHVVE